MVKNLLFASCGYFLFIGAAAQTFTIDQVLNEIEQNNKQLQAFQLQMESRQLDLKLPFHLPNPLVSAYYLPVGSNSTGAYSEFQISQSFEYPTIYSTGKRLIEQQKRKIQLEYDVLRQEVLLPAKKYCLDLIFLNRRKNVEENRVRQAKQVLEFIQILFEKDEVGILVLNKARIAWMQDQFTIEQIENDKRNILVSLQKLNGGEEISFDETDYKDNFEIPGLDSLWQEKSLIDPAFEVWSQNEVVSLEQIKLAKARLLPNLTAGLNYQGIMGSNYSGIYGGLSIPLWNRKDKVNNAEANHRYQQSVSTAQTIEVYTTLLEQFNQYQLLLDKLREYQSTLSGIDSEALLLTAYELGEISFVEYYMEQQFYRKAYDKMMQMESELLRIKTDLLKHQL
ncbi:MAG: TolC family protein [Saprospiraceae bacterium]|nr:TolC family protein [Saprospiraceae bacterium]